MDPKSPRSRNDDMLRKPIGLEKSPSLKKRKSLAQNLNKLASTPPPTPNLKSKSLPDLVSFALALEQTPENNNNFQQPRVASAPSFKPLPNDNNPNDVEALATTLDKMQMDDPGDNSAAPKKTILNTFVQQPVKASSAKEDTTAGFKFGIYK